MKHLKLISLIATLWMAIPTMAQSFSSTRSTAVLGNKIEFSLIRNYNAQMFYYVRTRDSSFFALSAVDGTSAQRAFIPRYYQVSDMEVLGNYAYFCGRNTATNRGFVGLLDIQNFVAGGTALRVCEAFVTSGTSANNVTDIRRLCAYPEFGTSKVHVVAIGSNSYYYNCILEIIGNLPIETSWNYSIGTSPNLDERFHDLTVTKNHVVTSGVKAANDPAIAFRVFNKSNLFATLNNNIFSYYSFYHESFPLVHFGLEEYHTTALDGDTIAVMSTCKERNDSSTTVRNSVMFVKYDVASMFTDIPPHPTAVGFWKNDSTGKADVSALRYDKMNHRVAGIVHYSSSPNPSSDVSSWRPIINANNLANVWLEHGGDSQYQSLELDSINNRYIAIGHVINHENILTLSSNRHNHSGCDNHSTIQPVPYTFGIKKDPRSLNLRRNVGAICTDRSPLRVDIMTLQRVCTQ